MSIFSISRKHKSPDTLPTPRIPTGLQQLPPTIRAHISSYLINTPKMAPQLVSKSFTQVLPIQHLNLSGSDITDKELINLTKNCKDTLISINLSKCRSITDKSLMYLASFKRLTSLNISDSKKLTSQGFKPIESKNWSLSHLFSSMGLTKRNKTSIPFPHLKELNINNCRRIALQDLPKSLTSLSFDENDVADGTDPRIGGGLSEIFHLENLTRLQIKGKDALLNQDLRHLSHLPNLTTLRLISGNKLTDEGLLHLVPLEHLTSLDLVECRTINNAGVQQLIDRANPQHKKDVLDYFKQSGFLIDDLHPLLGEYLTSPLEVTRYIIAYNPSTLRWEEQPLKKILHTQYPMDPHRRRTAS